MKFLPREVHHTNKTGKQSVKPFVCVAMKHSTLNTKQNHHLEIILTLSGTVGMPTILQKSKEEKLDNPVWLSKEFQDIEHVQARSVFLLLFILTLVIHSFSLQYECPIV